MKRNAIICIFLVLIMVMSLVSVTAFAETEATAGTFKADGAVIAKADDGYYYVNQSFTYEKNKDAKGYFYVKLTKEELKDLKAETLFENSSKVLDKVPSVTATDKLEKPEDGVVEYYAFADYYGDASKPTSFSKVVVLVVDTIAPVIVDSDKVITEWVNSANRDGGFPNTWIEATKELKFLTDWIKDPAYLKEVTAETTTDDKTTNNEKLLTVTVEYCTPNDFQDNKEWESDVTIEATTVGDWWFRFVVSDQAGNEVRSKEFTKYIRDTKAPEIELTSTQLKVETDGIKAGSQYTIPTPTYTDVSSVKTKYYVVSKLVNGKYVEIYNSDTSTVAEGYEKYITTAGVLTPASNELPRVGEDGKPEYLYKVVYHATDTNGMSSELELKIHITQPDDTNNAIDAWKIVLICISGACAVGIIVLICIKPSDKVDTKTKK